MKIEIERKFLLRDNAWRPNGKGSLYRQGYLCTDPQRTVRVRISGATAILAVKGAGEGLSRPEFEFGIPLEDAQELLVRCCLQPPIEKLRYRTPHAGLIWEIDEFLGANHGLILAEVELEHPDQAISLPPWAGTEVTADPRYYNAYLARHPYTTWAGTGASAAP